MKHVVLHELFKILRCGLYLTAISNEFLKFSGVN